MHNGFSASLIVSSKWGIKFTLGKREAGFIFYSADGDFCIFVNRNGLTKCCRGW
jgi:hypothetical protein